MSIYVKPFEKITQILYEKYVKEELHRLEELKNPKIVYVTDLVGCSHKYYLRRLYPELTIKFEPSAVLGNLVHAGIGTLLREKGFEVEVEVSTEVEVNGEKYSVRGRVDALKKDEGLVVEVKTARYAQDIPREHHLNQLKIYLEILNLENGTLIYITPDKIYEFQVKREKISLESLVKTLVDDTAHPRYEWECSYCMFRKLCPYAVEKSE
ncbi:CRISPR-associated protein Cas4 [Thermosphaera chiliense]|uniref:CRISPR-associated protein Cas4 n=1 Tax=Thermosphaera chiliense TaxID=3402707 RepID=UPI001D09E5BE|nr:CRISPR-associated protein Cas4 [Thermosphaera aggregans]